MSRLLTALLRKVLPKSVAVGKWREQEPVWLGRKRGASTKGATLFWNSAKGPYRKGAEKAAND